MSSIPFETKDAEVIGQIKGLETVPGQFGEQIQITVTPVNPNATNVRLWWFALSDRKSSKWGRFLASFNEARIKANPSAGAAKRVEDLLDVYVRVAEVPRAAKVRGEDREWREQVVREVYLTQDYAFIAWQTANPLSETVTEAAPVTPTITAIPDAIKPIVQQKWNELVTANPGLLQPVLEELFWESVKSWGFDRAAVFASLKVKELPF